MNYGSAWPSGKPLNPVMPRGCSPNTPHWLRQRRRGPLPGPAELTPPSIYEPAFCFRPHASAAARRREMEGCEWKNHSTHLDGVRSAKFCSASLFIEEMNGSTLAVVSKAYRSACRSLKRE